MNIHKSRHSLDQDGRPMYCKHTLLKFHPRDDKVSMLTHTNPNHQLIKSPEFVVPNNRESGISCGSTLVDMA